MEPYIPEEWEHMSRPTKNRKLKNYSTVDVTRENNPCVLDEKEEEYIRKRQENPLPDDQGGKQSLQECEMFPESIPHECQQILQEIKKTEFCKASDISERCTLMLDGILCHLPYSEILKRMVSVNGKHQSVPLVSKKYEESFMRAPVHEGESPCIMAENCECNFIDTSRPFTAVSFCPPLGSNTKHDNSGHMCVICHRKMVQACFYDVLYNSSTNIAGGVVQSYGNICGQVDEYSNRCVLVSPPNSQLIELFPYPMAVHQRNQYTVNDTHVRHLIQNNMTHVANEDFLHPSQILDTKQSLPRGVPTDDVSQLFQYVEQTHWHDTKHCTKFLPLAAHLMRHGSVQYVRSQCHHNTLHYHLAGKEYSIPYEYMIPCTRDRLQYGNLPDISPFIRECLLMQNDNNNHICKAIVHWMLRCVGDCNVVQKSSKIRKVMPINEEFREDTTGLYSLITCMYGTLMGLYPSCKSVAFIGLVSVYEALHAVLTGPRRDFYDFVCKHWNLAHLCLYEHVIHLLELYLPVELKLVEYITQSDWKLYCKSVKYSCQTIRDNINQNGLKLSDLDDISGRLLLIHTLHAADHTRKYLADASGVSKPERQNTVTNFVPHFVCSDINWRYQLDFYTNFYSRVNKDMLSIVSNVRVNVLPAEICIRQRQLISEMLFFSEHHIHNTINVNMCYKCLPRNKDISRNMRYDAESGGRYICGTCDTGEYVVTMCIIGLALVVCDKTYLLCSRCMGLRKWQGDGFDLCMDATIPCDCPKHVLPNRVLKKKKKNQNSCTFCSNTYIARSLPMLNICTRCVQIIHLCKKHYISPFITDKMYEINDLHNFMMDKPVRGRRRNH